MNFQNKSFLKIHNKTFIELLLDQLKILGYEIIINVNDDEEKYLKFGYKIVSDKIKGRKKIRLCNRFPNGCYKRKHERYSPFI